MLLKYEDYLPDLYGKIYRPVKKQHFLKKTFCEKSTRKYFGEKGSVRIKKQNKIDGLIPWFITQLLIYAIIYPHVCQTVVFLKGNNGSTLSGIEIIFE